MNPQLRLIETLWVSKRTFVRSVVLGHRLTRGSPYPDDFLSQELGPDYCVTYLSAVPGFRARAKMNLKGVK